MDIDKSGNFDRLELLRLTKERAAGLHLMPASPIVIPHERHPRFAKGNVTVPSIPKQFPSAGPVTLKSTSKTDREA